MKPCLVALAIIWDERYQRAFQHVETLDESLNSLYDFLFGLYQASYWKENTGFV